jgi:membrane-associated phospholipid phosphatase
MPLLFVKTKIKSARLPFGKFLQLFYLMLVLPFFATAQQTDSTHKKPDTLLQSHRLHDPGYTINFRDYFYLLGKDFKTEFTAPFHLKKKDWLVLGEFAGVLVLMSFADKPVQRMALDLRKHQPALIKTGGFVSKFGDRYEEYSLAALAAYSFIFKDQKLKTATLLASQAAITAGVTSSIIKYISWRQRPNYYGNETIEAEPIFHGPFPGKNVEGNRGNSSFPSGHTTAAFAAATIFATQYKDKPLIPVIMYTYATVIGLTRITENKHWATDVLAGAALGYVTAKQVTRTYERLVQKRMRSKKIDALSFSMQYNRGHLVTGFTYTFH